MQALLERHHALIRALALRIHCLYMDKEALIQAGIVGFMQAVKHYQPDHGAKLTTYAVSWILGEMKKALKWEYTPAGMVSLDDKRG